MKHIIQQIIFHISFLLPLISIAQIELVREKRVQSFLQKTNGPQDIYDGAIYSPKSALFSQDGRKLYINSLEGGQTLVYSWPDLKKIKTIDHFFNSRNQKLFLNGEDTIFGYPFFRTNEKGANYFRGKPVEMTLSHGGQYLWITYYRRDYDSSAQSPSAVAIVDTRNDSIVRVMPTGPIPKFVAVSPDEKSVAITHWGDNSIGIIDISSSDVNDFRYVSHLIVEKKLDQADKEGTDRDKTCGYCLRGTVFSPDSRTLFVARMGGGGIAAFDLASEKYLGTILNVKATPRHMILSPNGKNLIVSSNVSGYVTVFDVETLLKDFTNANGKKILGRAGKEIKVGSGARTIEIDPQGKYIFAAINNDVKVVAVDIESGKLIAEVKVDPYPVGLAVSREGTHVVVTSQGHAGSGGGNAVNVLKVLIQ